jgi:hypothetical protein
VLDRIFGHPDQTLDALKDALDLDTLVVLDPLRSVDELAAVFVAGAICLLKVQQLKRQAAGTSEEEQ